MKRIVLAALLVATTTAGPGVAGEETPAPGPAYYRPVIVDGMTFPVARSNWYSLIELQDDWHAPRMRLVGGRWQQVGVHQGNDIVAEPGTPIVSMTGGVVEATGWTFYSGHRVGVRGDDDRYYFYAHLSEYAAGIAPGRRVGPGDRLGLVGNTGYGPPGHRDEFPPHLHVGIRGPAGWEDPSPLVRRLYRRAVRHAERNERTLTRLAREGRSDEFRRLASRLYMPAS